MLLSAADFLQYRRLSDAIVGELATLRTWSLMVIQYDPELGRRLSEEVIPDFASFADRINEWYTGSATFGNVLDQSLDLLQQFENAVGRLVDRGN